MAWNNRTRGLVVAALALTTWTFGCGSSSPSESGAAQGPILGFGSVYVGGDRWSTNDAEIFRDGVRVDESALSLGMVVRVEGERRGNGQARATRIFFDDEVEGAIDAITPDGPDRLLLDVLGIVVVVDRGRTVFDDTNFDSLSVGDVIEVSGFPEAGNRVLATFVEDKGPLVFGQTEVELQGSVASVDPTTGDFTIRGFDIEIDANTEIDDDLGGSVQVGDRVEVEGTLLAATRILAREVDFEDDHPDRFDDFELEGIVSDFNSLGDFRVGGIPVDASNARLLPNRPDLVANGSRIEVEGDLRGGVLIASRLKLRGSEVRIAAEIASDADIDAANGVVFLLGIPVTTAGSLRFEDDRDGLPGFGIGDLRAGDFVEVRGVDDGAGGVQATRFERDDADDVELRGRVERFDAGAGTITILGVTVRTDGRTDFEDDSDLDIGRSAFFGALEVGAFIEAKDEQDGNDAAFDVADEVEFEFEDDDAGFDD